MRAVTINFVETPISRFFSLEITAFPRYTTVWWLLDLGHSDLFTLVGYKERTGRVGLGRIGRHTPVSATGRPPSVCRPRPTHDVTAGHVSTLALQVYIHKSTFL